MEPSTENQTESTMKRRSSGPITVVKDQELSTNVQEQKSEENRPQIVSDSVFSPEDQKKTTSGMSSFNAIAKHPAEERRKIHSADETTLHLILTSDNENPMSTNCPDPRGEPVEASPKPERMEDSAHADTKPLQKCSSFLGFGKVDGKDSRNGSLAAAPTKSPDVHPKDTELETMEKNNNDASSTSIEENPMSESSLNLNPLNSQSSSSIPGAQTGDFILNIPGAPQIPVDAPVKRPLVTDIDEATNDFKRHLLVTDIDQIDDDVKTHGLKENELQDGGEEARFRGFSNVSSSSAFSSSSCEGSSSTTSGGSTIVSPSIIIDKGGQPRSPFSATVGSESPGMSERKSAVKSPSLGPRKRLGVWSERRRGKGWTCLEAQFPFNYTNEQGRQIDIRRGDRYLLLKRTNYEWWHVLPFSLAAELMGFEPDDVDDEFTLLHSFYIPAKYVKEVEMPATELPSEPQDTRGHRRQGSTGTNYSATPDWKDDSGASNDGLEQPTPQPKPRKAGSLDTGPSATAEFKANLEGKISSLPRQDVGLVRMSKGGSLPSDRAGPPSPPSSSTKPVLLPSVPTNMQLRPTLGSTPPSDSGTSAPPVDDDVIYANIPPISCPPPPTGAGTTPANRNSCMWELPGLRSGTGANSDSTTPSDRPVISGPILMEGGACLQNAQKRGMVTKTKLYEYGKKMKKNWTQHFLVLSGPSLYFYKDAKAAVPKPGQPNGRPDMTLDLETVRVIDVEPGATKRKHVIALEDRGAPGSSVVYLLQLIDSTRCQEWTVALKFAKDLVANRMYHPPAEGTGTLGSVHSPKRNRSSMRRKNESGSYTAAATSGPGGSVTPTGTSTASVERQTVMQMLKDLFRFRPQLESLEAKGIIRNEPVFGTTLELLNKQEKLEGVPLFVTRCIDAIERRDGLNAQGVYRVNGNGATIQKLRCTVDQTTEYNLMDSQWDLEVLTGALKLFFRELKEPLIPCASYQKFVDVTTIKDKGRVSAMRDLIKKLPSYHHSTMKALFQHLHRVVLRCKVNQMHPRNIAIVFGPNLLWPPATKQAGSNNEGLTASVMAQNQIVEFILNESEEFFPSPPPLPQRAAT